MDAYPDKTFEGVIENIAPQISGTSRTSTAKVRIENPDPAKFKVEIADLPEGAAFKDGVLRWTPTRAQQGGWRPRFTLTDGLRATGDERHAAPRCAALRRAAPHNRARGARKKHTRATSAFPTRAAARGKSGCLCSRRRP